MIKDKSDSAVLVTGATGFIGSRLAFELAQSRGRRLVLLCRPKSRARLDSFLAGFDENVPRPEVIEGDLELDNLGLEPADLRRLKDRVSQVFHVAAGYRLDISWQEAQAVNVTGTRRVIDLAADLPGLSRFHYVSTMAVAGNWQGPFREDDLYLGQGFDHAYGHSKFLAEQLVRQAADRFPVTVYRPGVVVGDSRSGKIDKLDGPYYVFRILDKLRRVPGMKRMPQIVPREADTFFHLVPVDFVVDAMVKLAERDDAHLRTYHLMDPDPPSYREFYMATLSTMGFSGPRIARPVTRLINLLSSRALGTLSQAVFNKLELPREMLSHFLYKVTYDTSNATRDLEGTGISAPCFADYLPVILRYFENNMLG
jgi:thioester reductase-like protein